MQKTQIINIVVDFTWIKSYGMKLFTPKLNGEGSKAWGRFEMRIHKRLVDLHSPAEIVKQITSIAIELGVDVDVIIADV
ncbi:40S ribosomal protein S20 [Zancudomyces culisetae]|uniref:40S ribosomal protein S20 n=1 Tax=Zancudomyces culisetae TaxID=1213189 RepID=A0A1R1PSS2_ZANCU|nr:40S ribosomal protein S20 [Zancudomyces culisetae]|eukprot:OMH84045.1 40S ribosomal protein S20 [Zancudomyces culisetae]